MIVVLAEKPSVARDLAAVLGARARQPGYFEGAGYRVTWAIGHLVGLAQPHEIEPRWKAWSYATLPMLPGQFPLVVLDDGRAQYRVVERLLRARDTESVVAATDAGREGELIFRYIYERARCKKPWQRLWISSLTPSAIRQGFAQLQDGARYDGLAAAAKARSRADWLVGMNLSRAYTLSHGTLCTVGRVQTPTLAMVVERDRQIRAFVPEHYLEVEATFEGPHGRYRGTYHARPESQPLRDARGKLQVPRSEHARLPIDAALAEGIVRRAREGQAQVAALERNVRRTPPPLLYDLTELQRHANRLFGFTAKQTLDCAQSLYERHKLLSYPRTDSRHLTREVANGLPEIVRAIAPAYAELVAAGSDARPLGKRFVDDAKVTDHHALIPTSQRAQLAPGSPEAKLYDLVCRRLLMAWHPDLVESLTTLCSEIAPCDRAAGPIDLYVTRGVSVEEPGWTVLERKSQRRVEAERAPNIPPGLAAGDPQRVVDVATHAKQTEPPKPFSEATLLTAMETAGKTLDDKALMEAMRESGLGTPATRAATIETLLARAYLVREAKALRSTPAGEALVDAVHAQVKSAGMTGSWELRLRRMERGEEPFEPFMRGIEAYVREVVGAVSSSAPPSTSRAAHAAPRTMEAHAAARVTDDHAAPPRSRGRLQTNGSRTSAAAGGKVAFAREPFAHSSQTRLPAATGRPPTERATDVDRAKRADHADAHAPTDENVSRADASDGAKRAKQAPAHAPTDENVSRAAAVGAPSFAAGQLGSTESRLAALLRERFGHAAFRPHQEAVCEAVGDGRDVLCVMPTGAGKSLCYQLPGLVRGGTTVVISPLIALIEDQCDKLSRLGLRAERIHSGRERTQARETCARYLQGELDFLFIAPERLGVPGFVAMLAKRPPSSIAIDEAHCISQWGHDFRPDYRMLRERLAPLRPAPIVALTATATTLVQRDILDQLAIPDARRFVLGFRRENLAIELMRCAKNLRSGTTRAVLTQPGRLPAIVYTPTRADAERVTELLRPQLRAATYHAGLSSDVRSRVQARFLEGTLDCIVATIAFGMGIDKPNVRTVIHTALPATLEGYYQEIGRAGRDGLPSRVLLLHGPTDRRTHDFFLARDYPPLADLERVQRLLSREPVTRDSLAKRLRKPADTILEKLWIHGGAEIDPDGGVRRGQHEFRPAYARQRAHRVEQLDRVADFARDAGCRMLALVRHFGDLADCERPCGICDGCAPDAALANRLAGDVYKDPLASRRRTTKRRSARKRAGHGPNSSVAAAPKRRRRRGQTAASLTPPPNVAPGLIEALRAWRLSTARRLRVPAFRVLTNRQLFALASAHPTSRAELRTVEGLREKTVDQHGDAILSTLGTFPR